MKQQPLILFGAFDRHNFGDLLFPHIVGKLLPNRPVEFAGLADRDLRPWDGHLVKSLASLISDQSQTLIHCGGELLTCTAYQAAVMLQSLEQAEHAIAKFDADAEAAARWSAEGLQTKRVIPYVAGPTAAGTLIFNAVGGVEWPLLNPAQQDEVIASLKQACWVSVRDHVTQGYLKAAGVTTSLCPDPAVMVKELFDGIIQQHSQQGEVAEALRTFANGYIACQFSAEFGDDATLDHLAIELGKVSAKTGLGLVLFRAGAAPWHDRLEPYERLCARMPLGMARVFKSLHLWDICALISASRAFVGSSLHGSIVAQAYGLPHVSLIAPQPLSRTSKVAACLETWEAGSLTPCARVDDVEIRLIKALAQSTVQLEKTATQLAMHYKESQMQWMKMLI